MACQPTGEPLPTDGLGPPDPGVVEEVDGFQIDVLGSEMRAPVLAILDDGTTARAWIDDATGRVMFSMRGLPAVGLPDDGQPSRAVAMVAGSDRRIHLTWDAGELVRYVTIDSAGVIGQAAVMSEDRGADPNIALSDSGEVAVSWVERGSPPQLQLRRSVRGDGNFDAAVSVNGDCCMGEFDNPADTMSGASMAYSDDGRLHVVYEWMTWDRTVVAYQVEEEDGFTEPLSIALAAFSPCPALAVDDQGAHVSWLLESPYDVMYSRISDGVATTPESLFYSPGERLTMAMLVQDGAGALHMGVTRWTETGQALTYHPIDDPDGMTVVQVVGQGGTLDLSARAGGALVAPDGKIAFAWTRVDAGAAAPVAEVGWGF